MGVAGFSAVVLSSALVTLSELTDLGEVGIGCAVTCEIQGLGCRRGGWTRLWDGGHRYLS